MSTRIVTALPALLLLAGIASAASFTVDSVDDAADASPGDGVCATAASACTLRAAVQEANALAGADIIQLPAGTYVLSLVGAGEDSAATGDLDVTDELTIVGASSATTVVDGNGTDRVFDLFNTAARATISGVTIQNGNAGPASYGGGLYNSSTLTLSNAVVSSNTAAVGGGGIENDGDISLVNCVVSGNTAGGNGGGFDNALTARLTGVTLSGNSAASGGAISNDFDLTLQNVTLSGNTATFSGGGLRNNVTAALTGVTIAGNTASSGSAVSNLAEVRASYVLVTSDAPDANCETIANLTSLGHNLDDGTSCGFAGTGDLSATTPLLGTLADNGGPTPTHALLPGSPAIDAGGTNCAPLANDQRGIARPGDGDGDGLARCDIGAFEVPSPVGPTTTTTLPPTCPPDAGLSTTVCLLDELFTRVQRTVGDDVLRSRLSKVVARALVRVEAAQQAETAGKVRREKVAIRRALRLLGKLDGRLKRSKSKLDSDVAVALTASSDEVRSQLTTVRSGL